MTKLKYFTGAVFMLKLSFLYRVNIKSRVKKCLYLIWGLLYVLSLLTTFIQCVVYLHKTPFNLIEEAMVIMNAVIYVSLFINFTFLYLKRDKLFIFVTNINTNFVSKTDNDIEDIEMENASKLSDKFAYYWSINCVVSSLMPTVSSLIGGHKILPIIEWFPYDVEKSPLFELTYIWQVFSLINLGVIYAVLDLVFPCIAILMAQQFKILASNFKNNIHKALLESETPVELLNQNEEIFEITKTIKFQEANINYFKKNIKHHQLLLTYCEDINDILSTFLLGKISAAIFNTLFMAFGLITTGNSAMIFGLASYVMSTSIELLIYTYSGQILTENSDVVWALYESPWYVCDIKFQRLLHIVQMRTCKSVYTRAGNYFRMSAESYITFMKALGSYVALLKELTDRDSN